MTVRAADMTPVRDFRGDAGDVTVSEAARIVRSGGVIAMPTESVYALGADVFDEAAVQRVCAIKGQRERRPILVLIADRTQLDALVAAIPPAARILMDRFWPGPLTIVFSASSRIPAALTAASQTPGRHPRSDRHHPPEVPEPRERFVPAACRIDSRWSPSVDLRQK